MHYKIQVADVNIKTEEMKEKQCDILLKVLDCHYISIVNANLVFNLHSVMS